ncbi:hypothetical protein PVK06_020614 [Gossypium arboreum]|uniref:Uncharacterized protein n=1 Tax=Gossypium arboreum TaxID=29729 RepID=A0ABR0PNI5_GOSAR|nr:hypothetical protein PVK06_020614 [Gossypium arboreum]
MKVATCQNQGKHKAMHIMEKKKSDLATMKANKIFNFGESSNASLVSYLKVRDVVSRQQDKPSDEVMGS